MRRAVLILAALCMVLSIVWIARLLSAPRPSSPPPVAAPVPPTPPPTSDGDLVLDLFNPSDASLRGQLNETALKARLEDTITVSFLLRRCEFLTPQTYDDTYRALAIYAQRLNPGIGDAQLQATLASAIEAGSARYGLLDSRLSCDLPQLAVANKQLAQWRALMLNPPQ